MDILISIAKKVAEHSTTPIQRQLEYLIFCEDSIKELTNRVTEIEGTRDQIKHLVEAERRNGKIIITAVQKWLDEVEGVTEQAHKLEKDPCLDSVGCSGCLSPKLMLRRWQLGREAKKMATEVVAELQRKGKFDLVGYLPALYEIGSTSATIDDEKLESRKTIMEEILQALIDPKVSKIGVYGLGGVGKTHLVKQVAQKAQQHKLFDAVIKAKVSRTPEIKRIQGEIADILGLRFKEETVIGRAFRLRGRIEMEKAILLVLDDIWTRLDLEEIGIPFGDEHNGCKVLMTSRNQDVLLEMEVQKDFKLDVLSTEETWSLFEFMAGDVVKDSSLQTIAIDVAIKCAGLPLRIVTVARALKNKDIYAWKNATKQLGSVDSREMDGRTYSALELSYNCLEGDEMKTLFLLCAILDNGASIECLLKYAMGLDVFKHIDTMEDARNRLYTTIGSLKASCLLLDGDRTGWIKMHDIVREVAMSIAVRDQYAFQLKRAAELKEWPTKDSLKRCMQIILYWCHIHKLPERLDCPNLKFFYLGSVNRTLEIPNSIFERTGNLKVLNLTCINFSLLPTSFHYLTSLQTLCLDECILENTDAIADLKNLEILSLFKSSMIKLPSEIRKLTHLRMLDLSNSGIEVIPPGIISSLTKLEELYLGNTFVKWEVEGNASLVELRQLSNLTALELQIREVWMLPRDLMFENLERYKIVIGDAWEWSDIKDISLKTLKLKLGTNIHLEHGIKALIRRVENLYLDEVDGIGNVLYQLNGEGFPLLKHLHIQNNETIIHIINSMERRQAQVFFPKLETLVLHNLHNLERICHGPLAVNSFDSLRTVKVKNCIQLQYIFSLSMVKGLSKLVEMEVCHCSSMKKIIFAASDASADDGIMMDNIQLFSLRSLTLQHLQMLDNFFSTELTSSIAEQRYQQFTTYIPIPFFSNKVAFPNLVTLKLSSLNLNKIWGDNQCPILKLENLIVENCGALEYLFTTTIIGSFLNLKRLEISKCHMMEEIIATEEKNDGTSKEVQFSKLETIILKDMEKLKTIWHFQFDTLKVLVVKNCEKIVTFFASSMQGTYNNLESLMITDCASVKEIFELTSNAMSYKGDSTQLKSITLKRLSKLKQIWSRDPQEIVGFHNLQDVCLEKCHQLEYLFPLSVAMSCFHLKELIIKWCGRVKEIVANKEGSMCPSVQFEFNQLNSLVIWSSHELKGFYAGNHTLVCPYLEKIDVSLCSKLNLFKTQLTSNQERAADGNLQVSMQQPLFIVEKVISNLKELSLNHKNITMIAQSQLSTALFIKLTFLRVSNFKHEDATFPYWCFQNSYSLKRLIVEWSSFKEIFQDGRLVSQGICTRLHQLSLSQLPELKHICKEGSQIDPVLEFLEHLLVQACSSLMSLVPSSVTFSHLLLLQIINCSGLINLITSSTARSLAKLKFLKIKDCNSLEEIMIEKGDETVGDIAFTSLVTLKLEHLPRLSRFSSSKCLLRFPLLEEVVVRQCSRMKVFSKGNTSTPILRKVHTADNNEEWYWKEDLNETIKNMFEHKVMFRSCNHLKLSEYPELKECWYGQFHHNIFCHLKSLVVERCDFLSDVLFTSNVLQVLLGLELLEVRNCDSLKTVFDVKGTMQSNEMLVKQTAQLKSLTLSGLPKLKHIWNEDSHEIISFGKLHTVKVANCQSLAHLFSLPLCQDLSNLEILGVVSCGVEEIVVMDERSEQNIFNFPRLAVLDFVELTNLKSFFKGRHSLECPSLKALNVCDCEMLQMFSFDRSDFQQPRQVDEIPDMPIRQALFSIEKVSPNLEDLALNGKDAMRILNDHWQESLFYKVKTLHLQSFDETPITLLNDFIKAFPNLETFQVRNSHFEMLFPLQEGIDHHCIELPKKVRNLWLLELKHLRHIWHRDSPLDQLTVQNLEVLSIMDCPCLMNLTPYSVSFRNLTWLEVDSCKGLIYLITSSTAKSLRLLTALKIQNCEMIEDAIKIDEESVEEEIKFENLEYLVLTSLPSFRSFYYRKCTFIFPSLIRLVVKECPKMKNFSQGVIIAPFLTAIEVENGKERWKDDLNATIEQMVIDKGISNSNKK